MKNNTAPERFCKERLTGAKRFAEYKDILRALLRDDRNYTIREVNTIVKTFLERKI